MKFLMLWSGLCCCTVKCSEILAHIKLLHNPRVNKVFTSLHFTSLCKPLSYRVQADVVLILASGNTPTITNVS